MTISPPVTSLYGVLTMSQLPSCEREEHPFGFHDDWPSDIADGEYIVIELNDGSARVASNAVGHMMLLGQLYRLAQARGDTVSFRRFRCRPLPVE